MIEELKKRGNQAVNAGAFERALQCYDEALRMDPTNAMVYSNRAVVYTYLKRYQDALDDAEKTIQYRKGWSRVRIEKKICLHSILVIQAEISSQIK